MRKNEINGKLSKENEINTTRHTHTLFLLLCAIVIFFLILENTNTALKSPKCQKNERKKNTK